MLLNAEGAVIAECFRFLGHATNNVAEYTGLIIGLEEAQVLGIEELEIRMDSMLVVRQMEGRWKIKHPGLRPLAMRAGALLATFRSRTIAHVPRAQNSLADAMVNRAIDGAILSGSQGLS